MRLTGKLPAGKLAALVALPLLLAVLLVSGCGDDDESDAALDPFFGVAPEGLQNATDYERMRTGGVGTIRVVLQWSVIEPEKGAYNWTSSDQIMSQLAFTGTEPLVTVYGSPEIYAPDTSDAPTNDEKAFDAWADFLRAAAERYGSEGDFWASFSAANPDVEPQPVREWEIWNEPNSSTFWSPTPDPEAYADLLLRSAKVISEADPEAAIMTAGMFATPQSDGAIVSYDFFEELFAVDGVKEAVDLVGLHPYAPDKDAVIDQVEKTRATLDESGVDVPIWATEIGWGSDPSIHSDLAKTPEQQAELLGATFGELSDRRDELGLSGAVWYTWHDSTESAIGECGWCVSAGLVDADRDTKPAWVAYTELTGGAPD
ncbi:MAG TPA: beta-galactosidase [Solirubrobacterales bacterium]|nr:beta-galactosidase [Solirubrobacterales bacterium]